MIKMKCIRCKHDNDDNETHCYYCGYRFDFKYDVEGNDKIEEPNNISDNKECSYCGYLNDKINNYCINCGKSFTNTDDYDEDAEIKPPNIITSIIIFIGAVLSFYIGLTIINNLFIHWKTDSVSTISTILTISFVLSFIVIAIKLKGKSNNTNYNKTVKYLGTLYKIFLFIPLTFVYYIGIMFILLLLGLFVLGEGFLILLWAGGIFLIPVSAILVIKTLSKKKKKIID